MRAHDILTAILAGLGTALPEADIKESFGPKAASWLITRPTVAGQVERESAGAGEGGGWEARLRLDIYLPRGGTPAEMQELMDAIDEAASSQALFSQSVRGALGTDKSTGALTACCQLDFAEPGSSGSSKSGKTLTAIGESRPFWSGGRECVW